MSSDRPSGELSDNILSGSSSHLRCQRCDAEHPAGYSYCPSCGAALDPAWRAVQEYIDERLPEKIDGVIASRLKDQTVVEVQTAELVTERVLKWAKLAATVFGIPFLVLGAFLSFLGIKSYSDLTETLASVKALQEQAQAGAGELKAVQEHIGDLQTQIAEAQGALQQAQPALQTVSALRQRQDELTDEVEALRQRVGGLSQKYETGGRGPGTVSSGVGDAGGVSYGAYMFTSRPNGGTVARFVTAEGFPWRDRFAGLAPGTLEFSDAWRALAAEEPDAFLSAQQDYIKRVHYDPLVRKIKTEDGIDVEDHSRALQNVIWSVAVQHGPSSPVVHRALYALQTGGNISSDDADFDQKLIQQIYAERSRSLSPRLSPAVQDAQKRRYVQELQDALAQLKLERDNAD